MTDEAAAPDPAAESEEEELGWPFGFIAVLVLAALYLIWRFAQLGARLVDWIF